MPPVNSRNETAPSTPSQTTARPLDPLSYLSSPVPDFAATLHTNTQLADDSDEANVSFLRESLASLDRSETNPPLLSHVDPRRDPRRLPDLAHNQSTASHAPVDTLDDLSRRIRLHRVLARLNRIHDQPTATAASTAYGNRTPSPNRQALYDWAPSQGETAGNEARELDRILGELRWLQSDSHPDLLRLLNETSSDFTRRPEAGRSVTHTTDLTDAADRGDRQREWRRRDDEPNLRSRTALQARQEDSTSATERMLRYVMERERSGMSEEEERARGNGYFNPGSSRLNNEPHGNGNSGREPWPLPPSVNEIRARTQQERAQALQRRYVADSRTSGQTSTPPVPTTSTSSDSPSLLLEDALKYLNHLRLCCRFQDSLSIIMGYISATSGVSTDQHEDLLMDPEELEPLPRSSWLQPGTVFEGHQHATSANHSLHQRSASATSHSVGHITPNFRHQGTSTTAFDHPPGSTRVQLYDAASPWLSHQFTPPILNSLSPLPAKPSDALHDHWPVRVVIHAIDYDKMTLQGTMEAYDVPQHPSNVLANGSTELPRPKAGKKSAPITTYLEGHIIDLAKHSFLTPTKAETRRTGPNAANAHNQTPYTTSQDAIAFPAANAHIDASNWRKLPPFNSLASDEETAKCLLSRARVHAIQQEYIFMRWKERCFVHGKDDKCAEADRGSDQDRGHGLTISGFYYVSLRRACGTVEGLYYDPTSTPYQHLVLKGHRTGWPAVEFR